MKNLIWIMVIVPLVMMAADQKKKKAAPKPVVQQVVVPADAIQVDAFTWRYTDRQAKTWIYSKSPFGITRYEDTAVAQAAPELPLGMKAFAEGDKVRFETSSPFGVSRWVKSKEEMSDVERKVWERDSAAASATAPQPADSGTARQE